MKLNQLIHADVLDGMKSIPNDTIDCIITSPPYYQLRDYGFPEQWGLEKTYQEYLDRMILFMSECKRVIKPTGTIWINLGDSYNGSGNGSGKSGRKISQSIIGASRKVGDASPTNTNNGNKDMPNKSLMLIPHRFAIRCIDELGLILRNDIIWAKRNGMPESVTDRFRKNHEFIFFFVKSQKYYFDLDGVREKHIWSDVESEYVGATKHRGGHEVNGGVCNIPRQSAKKNFIGYTNCNCNAGFTGGIVLDPFAGTGTTLIRALELGRNVVGVEGNKEYFTKAKERIDKELQKIKLFDFA